MKKLAFWALATLLLAGALHLGVMYALPRIVTHRLLDRVFNSADNWATEKVNRLFHAALRNAGTDKIPLDNPDTITSFGFYDLSSGPVRVHCVIPTTGNYWSLSLYGWNTDNYFVINDKQVTGNTLDVVIVRKGQEYAPLPGEKVVIAPGKKGIILNRIIVRDRSNSNEIIAASVIQKMSSVEALGATR